MADTFDQTREQKIQSLQHSVAFLQSQHADTLISLHEEIEKLQKKCSGILSFICILLYHTVKLVNSASLFKFENDKMRFT